MSKAEIDCATYAGVVLAKIREQGATVDNLQRLADKILTIAVAPTSEGPDPKTEVRTAILRLQNKVERGETLDRRDCTAAAKKIDEWKAALRQRTKARDLKLERTS